MRNRRLRLAIEVGALVDTLAQKLLRAAMRVRCGGGPPSGHAGNAIAEPKSYRSRPFRLDSMFPVQVR